MTGWTLALCIASNKTLDSTDDWDERPFPDLLDCHSAAQANSYITSAETSLNMSEQQAQTSLNMSGQVQQQPPPPPFTV